MSSRSRARSAPRDDPAPAFAALGDATRLALVRALADGTPRSIAQLTTGSGLTRQAMTKHLRVLEGAGIIARERVGRESRFAYQPDRLAGLREYLDAVGAQWDAALARLRAHVED